MNQLISKTDTIRKTVRKDSKKDEADSYAKKDAATVSIINGLNFLINKANELGIQGAARTLNSAKEDLVYWAVQMNFHETLEEKFVNRHLYNYTVQNVEDLQSYMHS